MEQPRRKLRPLGWVLIAVAVAYPIYAWQSYSGAYRLLVRLQLWAFDAHLPIWTAIAVLVFCLALAAALIHALPGTMAPAGTRSAPGVPERLLNRLAAFELRVWLPIVLLSCLGLAGYLLVSAYLAGPLSQHDVSAIESGMAPSSRYVDLAGVPRSKLQYGYGITTRGSPRLDYAIMPYVGPGWTLEQPIHVFLKTFDAWVPEIRSALDPPAARHAAAMVDPGEYLEGLRHAHDASGRAMVRLRGIMHENDLSGMVEEVYAGSGLRLATPYYVLDHTSSPKGSFIFAMAVGIGGPVAFLLLFSLIVIPAMLSKRFGSKTDPASPGDTN